MRSGKANLKLTAGGLALAVAAGAAEGSAVPISYVVQSRSVSASASATGFTRGGTSLSPTTSQQTLSQQSGGFGDFAGNVGASSTLGPQSAQATAAAVQNSSLGGTGFSASGFVQTESFLGTSGPASASGNSVFDVTFNVSQEQGYTFIANLSGTAGATAASIRLTDVSGNNVFAPITTVNLKGFQTQGILQAGTYSLALDATASSIGDGGNSVSYSISLADGAVGTPSDGIATSTAVPLPPAWLDTVAMLGGLGLISLARRRALG
ncbi:MAG: hypothetical protein ABSB42_16600 [Tepidisphaeraceae bacterium]|jgi:hypothetical protein